MGDPEVHDLDLALRRHADVGGLDVAVHDAVAVGVAEAVADLADDVELPLEWAARSRFWISLLEVDALDELHGDVGLALVLAEVVDGDDVAVAQSAGGLGLAQEALAQVGRVGQARDHGLEGDLAVDERVDGLVDGAHAPAAQHPLDLVLSYSLHASSFKGRGETPPWARILNLERSRAKGGSWDRGRGSGRGSRSGPRGAGSRGGLPRTLGGPPGGEAHGPPRGGAPARWSGARPGGRLRHRRQGGREQGHRDGVEPRGAVAFHTKM